MTDSTLAENFNKYFEVLFAKTPALKEECYRIRHQVYSVELGWEPRNESGREVDEYDDYAYSFLLRHKRTEEYVGTIRLVLPPPEFPHKALPFEDHCADSMRVDLVDPASFERGAFGEASRLAVLGKFRRRLGEKGRPYGIGDGSEGNTYTGEERRSFPSIAIGLYLTIIAFSRMCNHQLMFAVMEPRFQRLLERMGLHFERGGDDMEYRGTRVLHFLRRTGFVTRLNDDMLGLYRLLESQLIEQVVLHPYRGKD